VRLAVVAETFGKRDGWASYSGGLLGGLTDLGVAGTVLTSRKTESEAPAGWATVPCLSSPLGALSRPEAIGWNAAQLALHARGTDLLHFMVEPYATASPPFGLPPTCITVHGTYASLPFGESWFTRRLFGAALRRAHRVFCVSQFTRQVLLGRIQLDNTEVIHNGHDLLPSTVTDGRDELLVDGRPLIVGVGALKPRKGYHVALRAVARLRERFPDLRYYLVGDDADRKYVARLRQDIAELGLERQAVITGLVSEARLRAFYRQADLFLLTPINIGQNFEGFGIAYLEANAYGTPVVGSAGCGSAEAIEDGVNGLLAPQTDEMAIAERAATILSDPVLARRLGEAGRIRAGQRTWHAVARQYLAAYEQILAG
jgi:glycosyltransferase involved in cell wall biosynthesis